MSRSAWTAWAVKNSIVMICFTALAVHFNHWWIVLFAAFFVSSLERKSAASRVCDGCGKIIYSLDWDAIDEKTERAGWIRRKNGDRWEDYCPECQRKGANREEWMP